MGWFNFSRVKEVIRYKDGSFFHSLINGKANYSTISDERKLAYMLNNPALADVILFNCDVFSLAKIKRKDNKENDPLIKLLKKPNHFQTQRQFLWMYRFWLMFGNAYLKPNSKHIDSLYNSMYWVNPTKLEWDSKVLEKLDKMVVSKSALKEMLELTVKYHYADRTKLTIKLGELMSFQDLANGISNWFIGNSRIDPLWKILGNTESALDAKAINLEFARKFLVGGSYDPTKNLNELDTMQNVEKEDIRTKLRSNEPVHPVKSQIEIKRFVEDLAKLKLDDSYDADLSKIGSMYNIPGDLLEAIKKGATYENQEKAIGRHISYSEMPKATELLEGLCKHFDLDPNDYEITFNDNSFMQVFEKEKALVNMTNARTLEILIKNGVKPEDAAEFLELDLQFKGKKDEG